MKKINMIDLYNNYYFHVRNRITGEEGLIKIKDFIDNLEVEGGEE